MKYTKFRVWFNSIVAILTLFLAIAFFTGSGMPAEPLPPLIGQAVSIDYPGYAVRETFTIPQSEYTFQNENDFVTIDLDVTDDAIYRYGYISNNEEDWVSFEIFPGDTGSGNWFRNSGSASIRLDADLLSNPDTSDNYIVVYTCTVVNDSWDCHDGWQIAQFDTVLDQTPAPVCGDGTCDVGETCNTCYDDCGECSAPVCGDGTCDYGESCSTCENDCGVCTTALTSPYIVSHYKFDGNADDEKGINNGQFEDGASIVWDTDRGNVLSLDGDGDDVILGSSNSLDLWEDFTLSSWINTVEYSDNQKIYTRRNTFSKWVTGSQGIYFQQGGTPGWGDIHSNSGITVNNWHHVVITHNSNNDAQIYIDGELMQSGTLVLESDTSSTAYIGSFDGTSRYFNGSIDDVIIWNISLSESEIQNLYNEQKDVVLNCSIDETRTCDVFKGAGEQTRTCLEGIYGDWSTCSAVSCDTGYILSGGTCVLDFNPPNIEGFSAGIAKVEITPPIGQPLGGYGNYDGCTSIHDPLHARVLVMEDDGVSVAFVSLDLLMFSSDNVIDRVKQLYGIDHVILSVTHTHGGPVPMGFTTWSNYDVNPDERMDFESFPDDPWYAETEDKVIIAVGEAITNMFPATISAGKGMLENSDYLAHNRRVVNEDGSITMLWSNPSKIPTSPLDPTVGVVRIHDDSGDTRAMMVNYACHPVHTGGSSDVVTADYPGVMSNYIENELGPDSLALFFNGAAGDIDPYYTGGSGTTAYNNIEGAGVDLAQEALSVVTQPTAGGSIEVNPVIHNFNERWDPSKPEEAGVTTVVIHDSIAFVSLVGEIFIQHQINLYEDSPLDNTFLFGYTYSGLGGHYLMYLPTIQAAEEGGYGASYMTYLEIGATEQMLNEAISFINLAISGEETCFDGILNQEETFTDCGGPCDACECLTGETISCAISNGLGQQSRTCDDGSYSSWSTCSVVTCNEGYQQVGNACEAIQQGPENVWCAFHAIHTEYSDGSITIQQSADALKEYVNCGSTNDHDTYPAPGITQSEWDEMLALSNSENVDGEFSYFFGIEWTCYEHIHYITMNPSSTLKHCSDSDFNEVSELAYWLSQNQGLGQINHPARSSGGTDFSNSANYDETWIPLVEFKNSIHWHWNYYWDCASGSGCTTYENPNQPGQSADGTGWIKYALDNGLHLGFSCGNDAHGGFYPGCYTGLANQIELTRQNIYDELMDRHTFVSEEKTIIELDVAGNTMGDIFTTDSSTVTLNYDIQASPGNTITNVNLFYNGEIVQINSHSQGSVTGSFTQSLRENQEDYLFIEVIQSNGARAWSSPVWITYEVQAPPSPTGAIIADHNAADDFDIIPQCWIEEAKQTIKIGYGHTSHGSQITSGINGLNTILNSEGVYPQNFFAIDRYGAGGDLTYFEGDGYGDGWLDHDVGYGGWDDETTGFLDGVDDSGLVEDHSEFNTIMWSWCGQVGGYVNSMDSFLINPAESIKSTYGVDFIYMTGHLDGSGPTGNTELANDVIRQHVIDTNGILFDFADIETWNPNGVEYPYETDACSWCSAWCSTNEDCTDIYNAISSCAHSHDYNCYRKAKAFWWMMARMAGWDGTAGHSCS